MATRKEYLPPLYYDHPGYFKVVASLVFVHFGLALDSLSDGPLRSPVYRVLLKTLHQSTIVLSISHALIAVLIVVGLYSHNNFRFVRFGCALSLVLFNVIAVAFASASFIYHLTYYSSIASVTLSLSSLAALKEPPVQAAGRGDQTWT